MPAGAHRVHSGMRDILCTEILILLEAGVSWKHLDSFLISLHLSLLGE